MSDRYLYHVTPLENLESIQRDGLIPQVGARSQQLEDEPSAVFLFVNREALETGLGGWLGEELEDVDLAVLTIDRELLPDLQLEATGFDAETICREVIPFSAVVDVEIDYGENPTISP